MENRTLTEERVWAESHPPIQKIYQFLAQGHYHSTV